MLQLESRGDCISDTHGLAILDVERPCQVLELALGEPGDGFRRNGSGGDRLILFGDALFPEVQFGSQVKVRRVLYCMYERSVVHFVESEPQGEPQERGAEQNREPQREQRIEKKTSARAARQ